MTISLKYNYQLNCVIPVMPYSEENVQTVKELDAIARYKEVGGLKKFSNWEISINDELEEKLKNFKGIVDPAIYSAIETSREHKSLNLLLSIGKNFHELTNIINVDDYLEFANKKNPALYSHLREYQKIGVLYNLRNSRGVLNGDGMRLGKTLTTIATLEFLNDGYPALIVCPANAIYVWYNEYKKWLPDRKVKVMDGWKDDPNNRGEVYIVSYASIEKHFSFLSVMNWKVIVCDESHYLKNKDAKRTQLVKELSADIPKRLLLSGTSILNRPVEIIPQLEILGLLNNEFGGFWKFVNMFCKPVNTRWGWDFSGNDNLGILNKKLRETCYFRRTKEEVKKELPQKTRIKINVKISNGFEYDKAQKDIIPYLREVKGRGYQEGDKGLSLVKFNALKQLSSQGKIKSAFSWIDNFFINNPDEKLVVFAWHKNIVNEIVKKYNALYITGDVTPKYREDMKAKFQNDPAYKIIVCNIQAGSEAIDLSKSNTVLFLELSWNSGTLEQAEERVFSMIKNEPIFVYYMVAEGTIEMENWRMVWEHKDKVTSEALSGYARVSEWILERGEG